MANIARDRTVTDTDPNRRVINENEQDEMEIEGFIFSPLKCFLSGLLTLVSGSLFLVLLTWRADIKLNCLYRKVSLAEAEKVLLKDKFDQIFEEDVCRSGSEKTRFQGKSSKSSIEASVSPYFVNKKIKYIWDGNQNNFVKLMPLDQGWRHADFHRLKNQQIPISVSEKIQLFGQNVIKISVPPICYLVVHEALNPFYLFQAYTVILWWVQTYWKFAVIIAITSVVAISASVWETRRQNRNLRDKVKSESTVVVERQGEAMKISSVDLVPGDILLLPTTGGYLMECDAVLVEGSCVVNESMLTGECIPITKISIPDDENEQFKYDLQRQYVVFGGTEVMQAKAQYGDYCKAVVIRTGFMTTKGELVRAILFPPPLDFKFHSDFLKSIYVFLVLGLIGMSYSLYVWISKGGTLDEILLNSLDILTFVVPPILPAAITANNAFAQKRLEKKGIHCLHSKHISLCGGTDVVAFDKTGTLTEGTLDLAGVRECNNAHFGDMVTDPRELGSECLIVQAMATCHSLIKIKDELTGNPLDVKLFEAIQWDLRDQYKAGINEDYGLVTPTLVGPVKGQRNGGIIKMASSNLEFAILKTYPFDSAVQRMTTVTKRRGASHFDIFIKGAPEKVASFCRPETVPSDFGAVLQTYTKQGLRVIAAGTKSLKDNLTWKTVDDMSRDELEQQCQFLGLIIMQNLVKKETYPAIANLHNANINCVMVTGDNILTAISVGRTCELVQPNQTVIKVEAELVQEYYSQNLNLSYIIEDEDIAPSSFANQSRGPRSLQNMNYVFACDGKTFDLIRSHDEELLKRIVQRGKIFARMLPEQKIHLIECLKDLGRQVVMCGDGCNDCGALKTAHAGISLSTAEASVAAPFTSTNVHIGCVPYLIREGRATMVSAFASFKFGVAFCFTQLIAVLMVFYIGTEPSDNQYMVVDIGLAAVPIMMLGNCGPHHTLTKQKPNRHLLSFLPLFSVISFLLFQAIFYVIVWFFVRTQPWFDPYLFEKGLFPPKPSYEQTQIFLCSCAAAVIAAIVFSKGAPFRQPIYTNRIMMLWAVAAVITVTFLTLFDSEDFASRMNLMIPPEFQYRLYLVAIMAGNFVFCMIWEVVFLDGILFAKVLPWYKERIRGPHLPFELLEEELKSKSASWPPLQGTTKSNEVKIVVQVERKASTIDQQTQTNLTGSNSFLIRDQLKNASRNIKNRWSNGSGEVLDELRRAHSASGCGSGGSGGVGGGVYRLEECEALLMGAVEPGVESPARQPLPVLDPPDYGSAVVSARSSCHPVVVVTSSSSSQLQRAINHSLATSSGQSKKLSATGMPLVSDGKRETMC